MVPQVVRNGPITHVIIDTNLQSTDRSVGHGRYRRSVRFHPRENTVDIDDRFGYTYWELRSIVDRRLSIEIILWSFEPTTPVEWRLSNKRQSKKKTRPGPDSKMTQTPRICTTLELNFEYRFWELVPHILRVCTIGVDFCDCAPAECGAGRDRFYCNVCSSNIGLFWFNIGIFWFNIGLSFLNVGLS